MWREPGHEIGDETMSDRYAAYRRLKIDRPEDRILRVTMDNPKRLNAADAAMHEELTRIWRDVDADASVSAVIIRGAGDAFSAGGDLDLVEAMTQDFDVLARVWKEARDLVYNIINCGKPIVSAILGPAVGAGLVAGLLARSRRNRPASLTGTLGSASRRATMRQSFGLSSAGLPRPNTICCFASP
jgi:1,4-dihydroxy-2-naphthoyl-CoA synthase